MSRSAAEVAAGMNRVHWKGTWFVHPLKRGRYSRRPHFYVWNEKRKRYDPVSFCEHDTLERGDLVFNLESGTTMEIDPLAGDYQVRRACGTCLMLVTPDQNTADMVHGIERQIAEMIPVQTFGLA